ncbi:MAG: hypothetical protein LBG27_12920 [Spirochaetaceae bacterium]|jgi:hypothetical protein|nr:hypothetical protein [Spirochaetaceae bacterium]
MTLTTRNCYLLVGIGLSLAALVLVIVFASLALPLFPGLVEEAAGRSSRYGVFPRWPVNPYVPFAAMLAAVAYAAVAQTLIYQFFEKTQSPEIFFFALFVFSFTFECGRMALPLQRLYTLPHVFAVTAERLELFGRFFGIFALFASSIYATGFKAQKQGTVLFAITLIALLFAIRIPIDPLAWDTGLRLNSGYRSMFRIIELVTALLAVASYLASARMRGDKEFILAGAGALLAFFGRALLLDADTIYTPIPALLHLLAGTWLVCKQLRRIYQWM